MIKKLLDTVLKKWPFFLTYFIFLIVSIIFLLVHNRESGHMIINQYWHPIFDLLFTYITYLGDGISAILVVIALLFYRYKLAIIAATSFLVSAVITQFLKLVVFSETDRPILALWHYFHYNSSHHLVIDDMRLDHSFPSGHATSAFSVFCILVLFSQKKWIGFLLSSIAILAAFSRVYLSQHFLEDIVWGSAIGSITSLCIYAYFENKNFGALDKKSLLHS